MYVCSPSQAQRNAEAAPALPPPRAVRRPDGMATLRTPLTANLSAIKRGAPQLTNHASRVLIMIGVPVAARSRLFFRAVMADDAEKLQGLLASGLRVRAAAAAANDDD
eukprot:SAG25_NODE_1074_length_4108_cov_3.141931_5_plen_108_part_00